MLVAFRVVDIPSEDILSIPIMNNNTLNSLTQ